MNPGSLLINDKGTRKSLYNSFVSLWKVQEKRSAHIQILEYVS